MISPFPQPRRRTVPIRVGRLAIGGDAPITVQSMTKTPTADVDATVAQIHELEAAGCDLIRVAVPDSLAAAALGEIKRQINIPLAADIHFDYRLALTALAQGVDKLRLNPGNLKKPEHIRAVVEEARARRVPIRIGANGGSLAAEIRQRFPFTPEGNATALVESALEHIHLLEELDFHDILVSLKSSDVATTVLAYRRMARERPYPLHIGITEAGPPPDGLIKSAAGMGQLLGEGIGDTLRVSLTAGPVEEVEAGWRLLRALELRAGGINLISCPTCGRVRRGLYPTHPRRAGAHRPAGLAIARRRALAEGSGDGLRGERPGRGQRRRRRPGLGEALRAALPPGNSPPRAGSGDGERADGRGGE